MNRKEKEFLGSLGEALRALRKERGWTLENTEEYGYPAWRHLQRIESGKNVTILTLLKICDLYEIDLHDMFRLLKYGPNNPS